MICINYLQLGKIFLISMLFLCDLISTYLFMIAYRKAFSEDDEWYKMEVNWIMKKNWQKWGIHTGTFITALMIYPILFFVIFLISENNFLVGMITGIYAMVIFYHILNFRMLGETIKNAKEHIKKSH